jgi:hypothetical protein
MRRPRLLPLLAALPLFLGGCLFTHIRTPLDTDLHETRLGDKVGEASARSILWLVAWGDAGSRAAAMNGGITVLRQMDVEYLVVLFGVYTQTTTIMYGD